MVDIGARQNDGHAMRLLKAARSAHRTCQLYEGFRVIGALAFVLATVWVAAMGRTVVLLSLLGFGWSLVSSLVLSPLARRANVEARRLQEEFDTYVFELPWNTACGSRIALERVHELAARFRADEVKLRDWYPDTGGLSRPFDVLLCQRATVTWNIRLRERWGRTVLWLLIAWLAAGLVLGVVADLTVTAVLLRWYVPSLSAIVLGAEIIRAQQQTASARRLVLARISNELEQQPDDLSQERVRLLERTCRQVQDSIFASRRDALRVPHWFYMLFRDGDEATMRATAADFGRTPR